MARRVGLWLVVAVAGLALLVLTILFGLRVLASVFNRLLVENLAQHLAVRP